MTLSIPSWLPVLLILIIALLFQLNDYRKKLKLKKELLSNAQSYIKSLAGVIREIDLINKNALSPEENGKLIQVIDSMPQIDVVKEVNQMLKVYRTFIEQKPEVLEEEEAIRRTYILPLMYRLLRLFSYLSSELHSFINERISFYNARGKKYEETVPLVMGEVLDKILSEDEKH